MFVRCPVLVVLLVLVPSGGSSAGVPAQATRAALQTMRTFSREAAQTGPNALTRAGRAPGRPPRRRGDFGLAPGRSRQASRSATTLPSAATSPRGS